MMWKYMYIGINENKMIMLMVEESELYYKC